MTSICVGKIEESCYEIFRLLIQVRNCECITYISNLRKIWGEDIWEISMGVLESVFSSNVVL